MERNRPVNLRIYIRAVVAIALFVVWGLSGFTGFLLWVAPSGPRAGRQLLLLGLTKGEWGDVHFWVSVAAGIVTIIHIVIDWRALRACVRYMTSVHRGPVVCE